MLFELSYVLYCVFDLKQIYYSNIANHQTLVYYINIQNKESLPVCYQSEGLPFYQSVINSCHSLT